MLTTALILLGAHILDRIFGDPVYPLHPVRLIGSCISMLEKLLRKARLSGIGGGSLLALCMVFATGGAYFGVRSLIEAVYPHAAVLLDVYLTYSFLATGDLIAHARPVADSLTENDSDKAKVSL